ncbi:3'(2'),5'-bisphosphate nucleotidase CysQ [Paraglaciecola hydrolytica]|uniref:3'(2'),5'-bisphosphate nucleotidase CysQ n=1 Tax=Paraglaciecola hydrolytica TaxID=1799789 RepID=A0A136A419_9ALTE|nr:3'(2'),5'-bisphosphate nucleotidase CysQ [Paraglaciecola hydrolytica]KXI29964.1 3'(2'),5'-bisphosphate nucleotidase CysQ [Paraglaciecola hydrolytica]
MLDKALVDQIVAISHAAGDKIMEIYQREFSVAEKGDKSPLTEADLAAHHCIVNGLKKLSSLPILSEESANIPWSERSTWQQYWLVDPLDGTKEFIKRNGEFTVNIALIDNGKPVFGVVYAPVLEHTYVGVAGQGAYKLTKGERQAISPKAKQADESWKVVGSRSHQSPEIQTFLDSLGGETELIAMGSSLKLCLVAEGEAHLYPRLGPTCEWDTGAAQAVVEAAGGKVTVVNELAEARSEHAKALRYNQQESVLNPYFLVSY